MAQAGMSSSAGPWRNPHRVLMQIGTCRRFWREWQRDFAGPTCRGELRQICFGHKLDIFDAQPVRAIELRNLIFVHAYMGYFIVFNIFFLLRSQVHRGPPK